MEPSCLNTVLPEYSIVCVSLCFTAECCNGLGHGGALEQGMLMPAALHVATGMNTCCKGYGKTPADTHKRHIATVFSGFQERTAHDKSDHRSGDDVGDGSLGHHFRRRRPSSPSSS
jgi:hypothetical protein